MCNTRTEEAELGRKPRTLPTLTTVNHIVETLVRKHRNSDSFRPLIFVETEGTHATKGGWKGPPLHRESYHGETCGYNHGKGSRRLLV